MNHVLQTSNTGFIKAWPKCTFGYGIAGRNNEATQASTPFLLLCALTSTISSLNISWKPRLLMVFHTHKNPMNIWRWLSRGGLLAQQHKLREQHGHRDTGRRKSWQCSSNRKNWEQLPPIPNPQMTVYATFFHKLTPKLALGLQFEFQPTLPPPPFAVCPVLLEPSARSSPSSFLCRLIWQLHFLFYSKNLWNKVVETEGLWQAKNYLEN